MGHRAGELRQAIAHILAVIVGSIISKDLVAVLVVDDPATLRIYPSILQHVEVPDTLALLDALQVVEGIGVLRTDDVVVVLPDELIIAEVHELIAHRSPDDIDRVGEVLRLDGIPREVEFEAAIAHRTYVDEGRGEEIGRHRDIVVTEEVLLLTTVVVEGAVEVTTEERPVETDVPVLPLLPAQVRVDVLARAPYLIVLTIIQVVAEARHRVERAVAVEGLVPRDTEVTTELEVGEPALRPSHKGFVRDTPAGRDSGEIPPLVMLTELRRAFVTE